MTNEIQSLLDLKAKAFSGPATSQNDTTRLNWLMEAVEILLRKAALESALGTTEQ